MSKGTRQHMTKMAELGCGVCAHLGYEGTPAQMHHPRLDVGGAQREDDWLAIPLCPEHHIGKQGVHTLGSHGLWAVHGVSEWDILAWALRKVYG